MKKTLLLACVLGLIMGIGQLYVVNGSVIEKKVGISSPLSDCFAPSCGPPPIVGYQTIEQASYTRGFPIMHEEFSSSTTGGAPTGLPDHLTAIDFVNFLIFAISLPALTFVAVYFMRRFRHEKRTITHP